MEPGPIQLLILAGLLSLGLAVERSYSLIEQNKTWQEAQDYCRIHYNDLATINSAEDTIQLQKEADAHRFSSAAWVGLYTDMDTWRWSYNNMSLGNFRNWKSNQPDNTMGREGCVTMAYDGLWADMVCIGGKPYICFKDTQPERYIFFTNSTSWYMAQSFCRQYYTDLAYAPDDVSNLAIKSIIPGGNIGWIGLSRDSWKWSDQTTPSTIPWMSGQPNNLLKNENCVFIENGKMADNRCTDLFPFFCQSRIKRNRLITRVEVTSNQNLNDPAVNELILDTIEKKLRERGLQENSTVAWRKKPDGTVFNRERTSNDYNNNSNDYNVKC
uniref:C-type lectin domain-containing protein n=1 Tax=Astyanax mexicanus TaxID=7994 RepID=A0A3B1KE29_ASTMX